MIDARQIETADFFNLLTGPELIEMTESHLPGRAAFASKTCHQIAVDGIFVVHRHPSPSL